MELDQKQLRVRGLHLSDPLPGEFFLLQQIGHELIVHESIGLDACLGRKVPLHQFHHLQVLLRRIEQGVKAAADLFLKLAQRRTGLLPLRGGVGRLQAPTVYRSNTVEESSKYSNWRFPFVSANTVPNLSRDPCALPLLLLY